jgi:pimeloyl-ACP methyl ester carboxylesterase
LSRAANKFNLNIIAIDRPGVGKSSVHHARTVNSWVEDVSELIRYLQFTRLDIIAFSGGATYAIACGVELKIYIRKIIFVSPFVHITQPLKTTFSLRYFNELAQAFIYRNLTIILKPSLRKLAWKFKNTNANRRDILLGLKGPDLKALDTAHNLALLWLSASEAFINGADSVITDLKIIASKLSYKLSDLTMPIHVFIGDLDHQIPKTMQTVFLENCPHAQLSLIYNSGHYLLASNGLDICRTLADLESFQTD